MLTSYRFMFWLCAAMASSSAIAATTINEQFVAATINPGDVANYRITVANSSLVGLTAARVTVVLPPEIRINSPANIQNTCGFTVTAAAPGSSTVELSGGSVPAGNGSMDGQCYFQLDVTSSTAGNWVATIPANTTPDATTSGYTALENAVQVWNSTPANATLSVNTLLPLTGSKSYAPSSTTANTPTRLSIALNNPNAGATVPLTSFSDNLPNDGSGHAMLVASNPNPTVSCTGVGAVNGTLTAVAGSPTITLTGGTIGRSGACTLAVNVVVASINPASTSQIFTNTLPADAIGNTRALSSSGFATNLTVSTPIAVSKSFNPTSVPAGQPSLLTITLGNSSTANPLPITSFADDMTAAGLRVLDAGTSGAANPVVACTGTGASNGSLSAVTGSSTISLANAVAGAGGNCTLSVYVTSSLDGVHTNSIPANAVVTPAGFPSPAASANLTTNAQLSIAKTVSVGSVAPGQWTEFTVAISNWSGGAVTGVAFSDILPSASGVQMVLDGSSGIPSSLSAGCSGGIWTGADGDTTLSWSNGSIAGGSGASPGVCTIKFRARVPSGSATGLTFSNSLPVGAISGNGPGGPVQNTNASSANVTTVAAAAVTKAFAPGSIAVGNTSTLTITVINRTLSALTNIALTDNLPSGVKLAANPAATNSCGGTLLASPGSSAVILTGGTVAARPNASQQATCAITVKVTASAIGVYANTIYSADFSSDQGVTIAGASANLTATAGMTGSKTLSPSQVTSGGTVRANITINNVSNAQVTNLSVLDNGFSAGLAVANPANASTSCAGSPAIVANPGATSVSMLGASLAAGGSCTLSFDLVTSGSGPWSNSLPAGRITTAEGLSNTATISSNSVTAQAAQININKSFNPVIVTGGVPSLLTIDVINPSGIAMTGVGFTDTFPPGIEVYSVPSASTDCTGGIVSAAPGDGKISLGKATLAANSTCHVYVQTTSVRFLNLTNTIPSGSVVSAQGYTNVQPTTASLSTLQGMSVMKGFSPAYMGPGQTTRLKMRLVSTFDPYAATPLTLTGVSFTDNLPAGLTLAADPRPTTDCSNATITANAGTALVTVSGVSLSPSTNCEVSVDVVAAGLGTYTNTIPQKTVTTNQGVTNPNDATAALHVVNLPTVNKAFSPKTVNAGQSATLTVTINNAAAVALSGIQLADLLPDGLTIAASPAASTTCSNGAVTAVAGSSTLSLAGATVGAGASCSFQANVVANANGSYINNISAGALVTDQGLTNPGAVSDTLLVQARPAISKAFNPVAITPGGSSVLTLHLDNSNGSNISLSAALVDALPGNLFVHATPGVTKTCPGVVTAVGGESSISYASGAQIPPGGCDISVTVTSATSGTYLNMIAAGQLVTTAGSNQYPATASLAVGAGALAPPSVSKAFSPASIMLGSKSQLAITLSNPNAGALTLASDLVDTLPAGLQVAAVPNPGGSCSGTVTAVAGSQTVVYAALSTIPAGSCTITVDVEASSSGSFSNVIAAGALNTDGGSNPLPATAGLVVTVRTPPTVSKSFAPGTINPGGTARLTISLGNANATALTLTSAMTDMLPANVAVATVPAIGGTCSLAQVTALGNAVSYASGATIPPGGCTIQVDVTSSVPGGPYVNTIAVGALQTDAGSNSAAANASLFVNPAQPPSLSKSFSPARVGTGQVSQLTISLANGNAAAATLTSDLTDTLPSGLTIATPPNLQPGSGCTVAKVLAVAGGTSVVYQAGGTIPPNSGCSISVDVVASSAASYTNTLNAGALVTSIGSNTIATSATLQVLARPTLGKTFTPEAIMEGGVSTLTLTLGNSNASAITLTSNLVDSLPAQLVVASPAGVGGSCSAANIVAVSGASTITYRSGASIPPGGCTIVVSVTSSVRGVYTNTIPAGALVTDAASNTSPASATLTVSSIPALSKAFSPTTMQPGATSTLTLTLSNPNAGATTLTADLLDTMPADLTVVTSTAPTGTCTLAGVTLTTTSVRYASGSTIPPGGCTISVSVTTTKPGSYVNTIPANSLQTVLGSHNLDATASLSVQAHVAQVPTLSARMLVLLMLLVGGGAWTARRRSR